MSTTMSEKPNNNSTLVKVGDTWVRRWDDASSKAKQKYVTTQWKDKRIMQSHSFMKGIKEIVKKAKNKEIITISVLGVMGTGKTFLSEAASCAIHTELEQYNLHYDTYLWKLEQFTNLDENLSKLKSNAILILDDVSGAKDHMTRSEWSKLIRTITTIRHRDTDIRVILFYTFHYTALFDKFLRGTDYTFLTSVSTSEFKTFTETYRCRKELLEWLLYNVDLTEKIEKFGPTITPDGNNGKPQYLYTRPPFNPCLFFNGRKMRPMITPLRTWYKPYCKVCDRDKKLEPTTKLGFNEKLDFLHEKHKKTLPTALRAYLYRHGHNRWPPATTSALKQIERELKDVPIDYMLNWLDAYKDAQRQARKESEGDNQEAIQ